MAAVRFLDKDGTFTLDKAENYSYLYLPVANEKGLKAAVTPDFGGDSKVDQNTFLMEPVSAENLHNNRSTRNFWCQIKGIGSWSVTVRRSRTEPVYRGAGRKYPDSRIYVADSHTLF